jgi:hypothetical protein
MHTRTRKLMTLVAVALTFGLLQGQSALAQSNCKDAKGTWVDVYNGGNTTSGTITNGGILNGTTLTVYTSGAFPTPVPTTVSYTGDLTITANQGQLKTNIVYIYDFPTGLWTAMGRINTGASTGRFAGATGVLYFNGRTTGSAIPITYLSEITGEICLVKE